MLAELLAGSLQDAHQRREVISTAAVERAALKREPTLDVAAIFAPRERVHIIAEVKRASPSRGELAAIQDPADLAAAYERGGASAVSVLTEQRRFRGSLDDLDAVRARVRVPVLRKEFIGEEYQLLEARAHGADLALLIAAALDQKTFERLAEFTRQLGMTPLLEAHSKDEVLRCLDAGEGFVGVNARDLTTFTLHPERFGELQSLIPRGTIRVAESAVATPADVRNYRDSGADAVLIGEARVTKHDPTATLESFLNA